MTTLSAAKILTHGSPALAPSSRLWNDPGMGEVTVNRRCILISLIPACAREGSASIPMGGARWAGSVNLDIGVYSWTGQLKLLTTNGNDFKPSWSRDGSMLTFFRAYRYGTGFGEWRSSICVINADGTGFRELTGHDIANFNPTWTRDGTDRIIFNRL
jgi:hypothetical protein